MWLYLDGVFKEVLRLNEVTGWGPNARWPVSWSEKDTGRCRRTQGKGHLRAKERGLRKNHTCQYLDLGLPVSRLWEINFCFLKPHSLWYCYASSSNSYSLCKPFSVSSKNCLLILFAQLSTQLFMVSYWLKGFWTGR